VITENDKGHYLLSRDLHTIPFWQLKEWIDDEHPLSEHDFATHSGWQSEALRLLASERQDQRDILRVNLADLFSQ
jgi:membrane protein